MRSTDSRKWSSFASESYSRVLVAFAYEIYKENKRKSKFVTEDKYKATEE